MKLVREIVPDMADAVTTRRYELGMTIQDLVDAAGITRQGLAPFLRGERRAYQDRLKLAVCEALRWTPDSVDRLLRGEAPRPLPMKVVYDDNIFDIATPEGQMQLAFTQLAELESNLAIVERQAERGVALEPRVKQLWADVRELAAAVRRLEHSRDADDETSGDANPDDQASNGDPQ